MYILIEWNYTFANACCGVKRGPTGSLADRVRVLTIWPNAIRDALKATEPARRKKGDTKVESKHTRSSSSIIQRSRERFEELLGLSNKDSDSVPWVIPPKQIPVPSPDERLRMFLEAVGNLHRVEEYEINWYVDHGGAEFAWTFPFFKDIWQSIGANLRRLTMDVQLFKMGDILGATGPLPRIEELNLTLRAEVTGGQLYDSTVLPYFINKLSWTLQSLSIKTIGHQELSFFRLLGEFPLLTKLSLVMPLDARHVPDPQGFQQLLRNHPRIRTLCIRYSRCCRNDVLDDGFCRPKGRHMLFSDISLPVLHTLELGLQIPLPSTVAWDNGTRADALSMISSVSGMADNLSALILKDRSLRLDEVRMVLGTFRGAKRLKKLSMYARLLTPQLVDVVAKDCPVLSIWEVDVESIVRNEFYSPGGVKTPEVCFLSINIDFYTSIQRDFPAL